MDELEKKKFTRFKKMDEKDRKDYLKDLEDQMDDLLDGVKGTTKSAASFMARVPVMMKDFNEQLVSALPNGSTYKFGMDLGDLNKSLSQADQKAYTKLKIFYEQLKAYMDTGVEQSQAVVNKAIGDASQAISEAVAGIQDNVDGIVMKMEDIVKEIQGQVENVVDQVKDVVDDVKDKIQEFVEEMRQAFKEFIDKIVDALMELVEKIKAFFNGDISLSDLFNGDLSCFSDIEGFEFGDEELEWQKQQIEEENKGFEFGDEELEWQLQQIEAEKGFEFGDEELEWQLQQPEETPTKKSSSKGKSNKDKKEPKKEETIEGKESEAMSYYDVASMPEQTFSSDVSTDTTKKEPDGLVVAQRFGSAAAWEFLGQAAELIPKLGKAGGPAVLVVQTLLQRGFKAFKDSGYMPNKEELRSVLGDFVDSELFDELMKTPDPPKSLTEALDRFDEKADHWYGEGGLLTGDANQITHNAGTVLAEGGSALGDLYEGTVQSFNQNVVHGVSDFVADSFQGTILETPADMVRDTVQTIGDGVAYVQGAVGNTFLSGVGGALGAAADAGTFIGDEISGLIFGN